MRPCKNLEILRDVACYRLKKLRGMVPKSISLAASKDTETLLTFVVINTLNTWSNFSRAYYLSCTINPRTVNRRRITTAVPIVDFNSAVGLAIAHARPNLTPSSSGIWHRRDEPGWHDHNLLIKFCRNIGCSNISDIQASLSFGSRVFVDLPVFRNFYAHRNNQTDWAIRNLAPQYGIPATYRPSQILLSHPLGRPQQLILDYIDDLRFSVELLCD